MTSEGINIVLAIDLSSSMLAQDFQPQNRLEVAKDVVKRFISARTSDRIGVVAFAAEALTQVPLTTDYPVVNAAVDNLAAGQLEDGTAIGTAIATAANRLRDAPGRSRVMILLTDGENNRGAIDPRTAAKAAAVFGIKIYTIGVGTEGMAPVPVGRGLFGLRYENRARSHRRAAAERHREDDRRPVLPRARCRGAAAHLRGDQPARARAGAHALVRALHGALSLAAVPRGARARRRAAARRAPRAAAMSEIAFDYPYAAGARRRAAAAGGARAPARLSAAHARDSSASATWTSSSRLIPPNTLRAAGLANGSARTGERARRRRGRRAALGRGAHASFASRGIDMVLALDASLSMMAQDERPSRLERMKQEVRRLRAMSPGDRMGVLAFAGRSYVLSPLTIDEGALDLFLDNLDPSVVGQAGSSLARTIRQGVDLLTLTNSGADRALVVMSDGEAFEPIEDVVDRSEARRGPGNQPRHRRIRHDRRRDDSDQGSRWIDDHARRMRTETRW